MRGLGLHIQNKMPIYTIYALQHAIHLVTQIELQIKTQVQSKLYDVFKRLGENLIKQCVTRCSNFP